MRWQVSVMLIILLLVTLSVLSCSSGKLQPTSVASSDSDGSKSTMTSNETSIPFNCDALAVYLNISLPADRSNPLGVPLVVNGFVNEANATVTVNEARVMVNTDGSFSALIWLKEGNNIITAVAILGDQTDSVSETVLVTATDMTLPPGQGLAYLSMLLFEQSVEIKAGESKTTIITFESRKSIRQPEEVVYQIQMVASEYSKTVLPFPKGLNLTIAPSRFMACPNTKYISSLHIDTAEGVAPGQYWFLFQQQIGTGSGGTIGWMRVQVLTQ